MAKKYTFKVTATLYDEDENMSREEVASSLREWLEEYEDDSGLAGSTPFERIEII